MSLQWLSSITNVVAVGAILLARSTAYPQTPTSDKEAFAKHARSLYYDPVQKGLESFTCTVKFDWNTLPASIRQPAEAVGQHPLDQTTLRLIVEASGHASSPREYAKDPEASLTPVYDRIFDLLSSLSAGWAETWDSKYLRAPIPEGRFLTAVEDTAEGYVVRAIAPPASHVFFLTKDYKIRKIVSKGPAGEIDENTNFISSEQGLVPGHVDGTDQEKQEATHLAYDVTYQMTDGFMLPLDVHLIVNDNLDVRFALQSCSVRKAMPLTISPTYDLQPSPPPDSTVLP